MVKLRNCTHSLNWLEEIYLSTRNVVERWTLFFGLILLLLFLFYVLGMIAENFLEKSLTVIIHSLKLSQNIAGVTLLAIGNGAPDIISAFAGTRLKEHNLIFGELIGAGILVNTMVLGLIILAVGENLEIPRRSFLRDCCFYLVTVGYTALVKFYGVVTVLQASGFLGIYLIYLATLVAGKIYFKCRRLPVHEILPPAEGLDVKPEPAESSDSIARECPREEILKQAEAVWLGSSSDDSSSQGPLPPDATTKRSLWSVLRVDITAWRQASFLKRAASVPKIMLQAGLALTIPVVDISCHNNNWNKPLAVVNCLLVPVVFVFNIGLSMKPVYGQYVPLIVPTAVFGLVAAILVTIFTSSDHAPRGHHIFSWMAFFSSFGWSFFLCHLIILTLKEIGVFLDLSDSILGLTLFAWGNSIGDMINNLKLAKKGFQTMALSACLGGPMFNILLGMGVSYLIECLKGNTIKLKINALDVLMACFLISVLIFLILIGYYRSTFPPFRVYGWILLILYLTFLASSLFLEFMEIV